MERLDADTRLGQQFPCPRAHHLGEPRKLVGSFALFAKRREEGDDLRVGDGPREKLLHHCRGLTAAEVAALFHFLRSFAHFLHAATLWLDDVRR